MRLLYMSFLLENEDFFGSLRLLPAYLLARARVTSKGLSIDNSIPCNVPVARGISKRFEHIAAFPSLTQGNTVDSIH